LAGYCIYTYLLQIKDRHNGNILLDALGHIIHIDFGFMLCISPGGINFENAPFKLTTEYVELMGGLNSEKFTYFKLLMWKGFMELRKYADSICYLLQIMMEESDLPCFSDFNINIFRSRFKENYSEAEMI
jgi:phosphatidylinositol kinase/protein kinase (PI-3  family)